MARNLQNSKEQSPRYQAVRDAIGKEFAVMMARNMDFSPTPEDLPLVADVLAMDLVELGITDVAVIRNTLKACGRTYEKWPSTATIVSLLKPEKRPNSQMYKQLAHEKRKEYTPEEIERIRGLIAEAKRKLGVEPPLTPEREEELLKAAKESFGGAA